MSKHFERKISFVISKRIIETSISPNQMTLISVSIGLIGALLIGVNRGFWQISGSILFLAHSILDGCDGENENNKVKKFVDFLTRRYFIYLIIIL